MIESYIHCAPYCAMCVHFAHHPKTDAPICRSHIVINSAFEPVCSRFTPYADLRIKRKKHGHE